MCKRQFKINVHLIVLQIIIHHKIWDIWKSIIGDIIICNRIANTPESFAKGFLGLVKPALGHETEKPLLKVQEESLLTGNCPI